MPKMILAAVCVLLLLLYLFSDPRPTQHTSITHEVHERLDSALVTIDKTPPSVCVNSKLTPRGHKLTLDTILSGDTLHVSLAPDSTIQIRLLPAPRIVNEWVHFTRRDSLIRERVCELVNRPWYESPLLVIIGAVLGFLIAILL